MWMWQESASFLRGQQQKISSCMVATRRETQTPATPANREYAVNHEWKG